MVDFCNSPFYINDCAKEWIVRDNSRRTAGVFTQGFGGGNGFTIIQEYVNEAKQDNSPDLEEKPYLFLLSALTKTSFENYIERYLSFLQTTNNRMIGEICFTAAVKRKHYSPYRLAVITSSKQELYSQLKSYRQNSKNLFFTYEVKEKNSGDNKRIQSEINDAILSRNNEKLARLFISGFQLDLKELFSVKERNNVDLPMYSFDCEECWI